MTANIGDKIMIRPQGAHQPVHEGEIREIRDDPDGIAYLVRWSDTGYENLLRPGPDVVVTQAPGYRNEPDAMGAGGEAPRLSGLLHPLAWRHNRELEREQQAHDAQLARRLQDVLFGLGLTHIDFSVGAGRTVHAPDVVAVTAGPPVGLDIDMLPGQTPDDYAAHSSAIAYNLGVDEIRIVPLGPSRIRLELLPRTRRAGKQKIS